MHVFYTSNVHKGIAILDKDELHHLRVLRYKQGDSLVLMDGKGHKITGTVLSIGKKAAQVSILGNSMQDPQRRELNMCIAPTKNLNRIEWCVEKMVEFGLNSLYFFISAHSERRNIKLKRIHKKIIAASKQSYKWYLPTVYPIQDLDNIINNPDFADHLKVICHLGEQSENIIDIIRKWSDKPLTVLVGPEGDFNDEELRLASNAGWHIVHLGDERLRTETAALYAASLNYSFQFL